MKAPNHSPSVSRGTENHGYWCSRVSKGVNIAAAVLVIVLVLGTCAPEPAAAVGRHQKEQVR